MTAKLAPLYRAIELDTSVNDVRIKLISAMALVTCVALTTSWLVLASFTVLALLLWLQSDLGLKSGLSMLLKTDAVILFSVVLLPFTVTASDPLQNRVLFTVFSIPASQAGVDLALLMFTKVTICFITLYSLLYRLNAFTLGDALLSVGTPKKLVMLLQFSVRYIHLLKQEFDRLLLTLKARGFKAGLNLHTWQTYGNLFGIMVLRSLDRAERVYAAMRCRGYRPEAVKAGNPVSFVTVISKRDILVLIRNALVIILAMFTPEIFNYFSVQGVVNVN